MTRRRRGAVQVWVVLCSAVLVGLAAFNLDGGRVMDGRRAAQATADAAALAAGAKLYAGFWTDRGGPESQREARKAALAVAAANRFPESAVTVNMPPAAGAFAGQPGHAEVVVRTRVEGAFSRVFTGEPLPVSARSVGRGKPLDIGVHALRPHGAGTFTNNAAAFVMVNKPIIVNSDDPAAYRQTSLLSLNVGRIDVTGGLSNLGLISINTRVRTKVRPTLDPLAFLPVPDAAAAPVRSSAPLVLNGLVATLQPGVYRGGVRVTGLTTVVMAPGVYVMEGGGFVVDGAATVTGLGVMIYNTTGAGFAPGPVRVSGLGKVVLTAPLAGPYQGINVFQNRELTEPVEITGVGLTVITGTVYAARAPVTLTGLAAVGLDILGGAFVADTVTVQGAGAVTVDLKLNPPRVPDVRVVE
jgi:hypothetical protein